MAAEIGPCVRREVGAGWYGAEIEHRGRASVCCSSSGCGGSCSDRGRTLRVKEGVFIPIPGATWGDVNLL